VIRALFLISIFLGSFLGFGLLEPQQVLLTDLDDEELTAPDEPIDSEDIELLA
jgi:hypothetical protein